MRAPRREALLKSALLRLALLGDGPSSLAICEGALALLAKKNLFARAEVAYARSLACHAMGEIGPAIHSGHETVARARALGLLPEEA